jgi:hypothetical protein
LMTLAAGHPEFQSPPGKSCGKLSNRLPNGWFAGCTAVLNWRSNSR